MSLYISRKKDIMMVRGDTVVIKLNCKNLGSDLTKAYFSCKKKKTDESYIFQKSLSNGIEKTSETETDKIYTITISPEDTDNIVNKDEDYQYDVQIEVGDYKRTPFYGTLSIVADVTED